MNYKKTLLIFLPYILALGLFLTLIIAGPYLFKDFGVPIDETYQLQVAQKNHDYIIKSDPSLLSFKDRYYGVVFEIPLFWIATRFTGPDTVYIRHLLLYLAFLSSLVVFYLISLRLFRNPWWSLLAVCFLAFSPRIFSEAFYNSKDIAFMDVFILAIWTLVLVIDSAEKQKWPYTIFLVCTHALASALLIGTRILGTMIVPISVVLIGIAIYKIFRSWRKVFIFSALYLALTAGLTTLIWPILWHDPLHELINAFQQMSRFNMYGKGVLFQGNFYPPEALPWQYLPAWIAISTPIIVLVGFMIGFGNWIKIIFTYFNNMAAEFWEGFSKWISEPDTLRWLAIISWLAIPVFSIYLFHSVLYNGWRHLFFIYPAIVLFSTRGFSALHKYLSLRTRRSTISTIVIAVVLAVGFFDPISFLTRYHRYRIVYFNQLAGDPKTLRQQYEMDYWGLAYKEAIDYILATDLSNKIPIYMAEVSGPDYINSGLSPKEKERIIIKDSPDDGARYFIGNYSFHPEEYEYAEFVPEYFSVIVRGAKILVVYRFQQP